MPSEMSGGEEIRRVARLYLEQAQAVSLNGRWAAFTDDELGMIEYALGHAAYVANEDPSTLLVEAQAEIERRRS